MKTLGQIAGDLSKVNKSAIDVRVDDAVAQKQVCLYGQDNIESDQLVRYIAQIYALSVQTSGQGKLTISLPQVRSDFSASQLGAELKRVAPDPLLRYLSGQARAISAARFQRIRKYSSTGNISAISTGEAHVSKRNADDSGNFYAVRSIYFPAVKQLVSIAQPLVPTPKSAPVPIATAGPEAERLVTLILCSGECLQEMAALQDLKYPACLTDTRSLAFKITKMSGTRQERLEPVFGTFDGNKQLQGQITEPFIRDVAH